MPKNFEDLFTRGLEIELVFDRFLVSENEELELKAYLRSRLARWSPLQYVTQVDSDYSDHVQFADYLGKLAKDYLVDKTHDCKLEYIKMYSMDQPDHIVRMA